jgi:type III secretory pathway component EscU
VTNILQGLVTPPLVQNAGCGAYVFFAVFCLLAFIFTYFVVPETAGKSLEEMDRVFKDVSSEAEEQQKARIMQDIVAGKNIASTVTP